ncbi:MAG: pilus assembly protein PilM [Ignavibacteriae bacterium]|nr:pilus assembly protein PilM [Ignavibacteria bacterium]MBI3365066.1 pilus assembly protein PilM [Ignavibacteriota bacterium]
MFSHYVAGISMNDGKAQLVVLQVKKRSLKLRYLSEYAKNSDDRLWFLEPIIKRQEKIFRRVKKVSIALDNASVFLHNFPTDSTLSQLEMNDHLAWELSQFIPEYKPKEYAIDIHVLKTHALEKVTETFVVAAQQSLIYNIEQALARNKYELGIVDTNHFGAEYALSANVPEAKTKKIALVGVTGNRADLGVLTNGKLTSYCYTSLAPQSDLADLADFLAPHIHTEAVSDIFLYGSAATNPLANNLRGRFGVNVSFLNPFKHIGANSCRDGLEQYAGNEHIFAPAAGCALGKQ